MRTTSSMCNFKYWTWNLVIIKGKFTCWGIKLEERTEFNILVTQNCDLFYNT